MQRLRLPEKPEFARSRPRVGVSLLTVLALGSAVAGCAQAPSYTEPAPSPLAYNMPAEALRTPEELDDLLAPIALYPDVLVALILPATTASHDVVEAAAFLKANGDPALLAAQPWDDSVKSLAHYPEIVQWMTDNLTWTLQAGQAFLLQPADVMRSIQQLRAKALAAGTLVNTPQQRVVLDGAEIRIVPVQSDVIYVPRYDPDFVYEEQLAGYGSWVTFGVGFPVGDWLNCDLDWDHQGIWVGDWQHVRDYRHPGWRNGGRGAGGDRRPPVGHPWQPKPGQHREPPHGADQARPPIDHPRPLPGAPEHGRRPSSPAPTPGRRPETQSANAQPAPRENAQPAPRPAVQPAPRPTLQPAPRATASPAPRENVQPVPRTNVRPDPRGYPPANQGRPAVQAPPPTSVFGGYGRGSDARDASQRGMSSRQEVQSAPAARSSPPSSDNRDQRRQPN